MAWFKVDDKLHSHPKRWRAGLPAMGLWLVAGSWSSDQLTDGFIPDDMLVAPLGGTRRAANALVDAGLWERVEGGYQFHDWEQANPSKQQVTAQRQADADRKAQAREARKLKAVQ